MPRKRKNPKKARKIAQKKVDREKIKSILYQVQLNQLYNRKYAEELRQLYERVS